MNGNEFDSLRKRANTKYNYAAPVLFGFSMGEYHDEMQKERNRKLYLKLKEVEKKIMNVKKVLNNIAKEQIEKFKHNN